jgi:hypothetical protein
MYGISDRFQHYTAILRERSACRRGDAQLRSNRQNIVGLLCGAWRSQIVPSHLTQHAHSQYSIDCSSIKHLSEGTRNAP